METPFKPDPTTLYATLLEDIKTDLADLPDDKLEVLTRLVNRLDQLDSDIIDTELALKELEAKRFKLATNTIPDLMLDVLNVRSLELPDRRTVRIDRFVSAHITAEKKADALQWLRDNGYDGIIKKELTVVLGKTPEAKVKDLVAQLISIGFNDITVGETVHGATLKKWARETLEAEAKPVDAGKEALVPVPRELFGIFDGRMAKIK